MDNGTFTTLGQFLAEARSSKRSDLSLAIAAKECGGLSGSYLHKLERDEVRRPSPTILKRLSDYYGADYAMLMEMAGYPADAPEPARSELPRAVRHLLRQQPTATEAAILLGVLKVVRRESGRGRAG